MTDHIATERLALIGQIRQLAAASPSLHELQTGIVETAAQRLSHFNWTGFYMLDPAAPEMLVLGPFVGAATPHVRIPVTQGICGAAVLSGQTVIVDDVGSDPRYLSCSVETKSEIVVPIYANGTVVGEIDIDSHDLRAFGPEDRSFLEQCAAIFGQFLEEQSKSLAAKPRDIPGA